MAKRKVCVVVTARPSYSRVKTALQAIKDHAELELQLVVAASALLDRYGKAVNYIEADGFTISGRVYNLLEGESVTSMAKTTGIGIMELSSVFLDLQPDVVVTVADRYETMATAIAASYMNIPLAHIQGGEVTGNIDEKVRHAITKLSDIHLVASQRAFERVELLGEEKDSIYMTGCPSIDIAKDVLSSPALDFNPNEKYGGVGPAVDAQGDYIVVLQHPVTTQYELAKKQIETTLKAVDELGVPTYWFWPNVDAGSDGTSKGIRSYRELVNPKNITFFKNMEPLDFLRLLINSRCLVGNSSVGIRECAYLGVPVVNIGNRQSGRERGKNVIDVEHVDSEITAAIQKHMSQGKPEKDKIYGDGNAGKNIADALAKAELKFSKQLTY